MIKGLILSFVLLLTLFLVASLIEHFGYLSSVLRGLLFWFYIAAFLLISARYIFLPFLQMHRLGPRISYSQAAQIIGDFFPEVKDKLLNLLQLQSLAPSADSDLLQATIDQKTALLSPIPFHKAVNIKANRKYLKYALIPLVVLIALLIFAPASITHSSQRILHYNTYYQRPAPFSFVIDNDTLQTIANEDFTINVSIQGNVVPSEAFVLIGKARYKMQPVDKSHFSYTFKHPHSDIQFSLEGGGVSSAPFTLTVLPKPIIASFSVALTYPAYIHRDNELLLNEGDLSVPRGTVVKWIFQTQHVDSLSFYFDGQQRAIAPDPNGRLSLSLRVLSSFDYSFFVSNSNLPTADTLSFSVSAIPDTPPLIAVVESIDSTLPDRRLFYGRIKDDYGFSSLALHIVKTNPDDTSSTITDIRPLALSNELSQEFYYSLNLNEIPLNPGDHLSYYFQVCDNNAVDGPQCVSSQQFAIEIPTDKELDKLLDKNTQNIERQAESSISELKKLQEDINELMRKLIQKKDLDWQDKKQLEQLSQRQKEVRETLQNIQKQLQENTALEQKYRDQSQQILEKQNELERLFNEVLNDEMKEMLNEIDKLLNETDKKKVQEELQNLKISNDDLEKQIDQDLDLLKRLEVEKKVEETIKKIDNLAEKQHQLSQQADSAKNKQNQELINKQQELSSEYQQLKEEINQIKHDYKQLDPSANFQTPDSLINHIKQQQSEAQNSLNKGKNKQASKHQKSAADDLEKLSEKLAESQMNMEQQDLAEDSEQIRHILKNLVTLSFSQEKIISSVSTTLIQDPKYQTIISDQNAIKRDFQPVQDSLRAIAKRQIAVASAISKELASVNSNVEKSLSQLLEFNQSFYANNKNYNASKSMQYSMTSINNLALVLAESLDDMQNQMRQNQQQKKKGSCKRQGMKMKSNCSNPGSGKPSPKSLKQMQDELNKQMEALKKQLEKQGNKPGQGRKKIGEGSSLSQQFAKMAAQQEQIRRLMQQYGQEMKQQNAGNGKLAKEIDEMMRQMEQTETDLVNKTITQQTIRRQQQILSRLLEHEKAEMQREKEQRRESHEAADQKQTTPPSLEQYKKLQKANKELFHSSPASLKPFYKSKVNDYFFIAH